MTKKYQQQSLNYQNIFDYESGFMRSKDKDGKFREPFSANRWGQDYAEGSAWQSSFAVYHDFSGLIGKYGGSERYKEKLIELCNQPQRLTQEDMVLRSTK